MRILRLAQPSASPPNTSIGHSDRLVSINDLKLLGVLRGEMCDVREDGKKGQNPGNYIDPSSSLDTQIAMRSLILSPFPRFKCAIRDARSHLAAIVVKSMHGLTITFVEVRRFEIGHQAPRNCETTKSRAFPITQHAPDLSSKIFHLLTEQSEQMKSLVATPQRSPTAPCQNSPSTSRFLFASWHQDYLSPWFEAPLFGLAPLA
jgi:hypothetical protein